MFEKENVQNVFTIVLLTNLDSYYKAFINNNIISILENSFCTMKLCVIFKIIPSDYNKCVTKLSHTYLFQRHTT